MSLEKMFPLGRIVASEDVVDRKSFIQQTKMRLSEGNSVMLSGPRRTGKSSVAHEIMRQLQDSGHYIASVDLFHVTSVEELATKLLQSILENRTGMLTQVAHAIRQWKEIFFKADIHAKIQDLELGITLDRQSDANDLLETAIHVAEKLATKDGKHMVILLDEFQELERLGGQPLLKRLRASFQQQSNTSYFFLGSESSLLNTIFADRRQAFYRFATLLQLPKIPDDEWNEYIVRKLKTSELIITSSAFATLLTRTGGHPYCVMSVMANAYLYAKTEDQHQINAEVIHVSYEQSLTQLDAVYEEQWQEVRRFKGADSILTAILLDKPVHQKTPSVLNASRAIQNLIRLSIVRKGADRGRYELLEPMFGDWVLRKRAER